MTVEEILAGESKNIEYKVQRPDKSIKYMKSVVAFANGRGGRIVFGIDDKTREAVGIPEDRVFQEMDAITNAISDSCEPAIIPDVYLQTINGKAVIIAEISAGRQKPYYIKAEGLENGVYIRVSGTTRPADRDMSRELYYECDGRSYDSVIRTDFEITEEEIQSLCARMKEVALANCKSDLQREGVKDVTRNVLLGWGILKKGADGKIYPTNAYLYLTGHDSFHSKIQCGVFKGNTRSVFLDKRDYEGPLWEQADNALKFVLRNIRLGCRLEGIYRQDIYELPPDSIRELIMNAVMNCSYIQPSHIQVAVYDDRLEVTSPGGLLPGVTIDLMKEGFSKIRNRSIANAFAYMNLIEAWGSGIPRMVRTMEEYGLQEPEFIDMEVAFRINLYRNRVHGGDADHGVGVSGAVNVSRVIGVNEGVKYNFSGVREGADVIKDDVDGVKKGVGGVKKGVDGVKEDVGGVKKGADGVKEGACGVKEGIDGVKNELGNVEFDLKTELDVVERYHRLAAYMEVFQSQKLLNIIKNSPELTQAQYAELLGVSKRTISRMFSLLQEQGVLEQQGTRRKPKWDVIKSV